jgi:glycerophosphoryl diester phosphodiesterase
MSRLYPFSSATPGELAVPSLRWVTIAHGGSSGTHGDNTEAAFLAAIADEAGIETADRRTRDLVHVLAHDRLIAGVAIDESAYDELLALNSHLVTTRWLLEHSGRDDLLVIEVTYRDLPSEHGPIEISLLEELERVGRLAPEAASYTAVSSFSPGSLLTFREHAPQLHRLQILEGLRGSRPDATLVGQLCDGFRELGAIGIVPNVTDLGIVPWVHAAHERALGVFPYPDSAIVTREQHRAATALMISSGCDGGHVNYLHIARALQGYDALPATEAMRRFLTWRGNAASALASPAAPTEPRIGQLTAQLVALGDGVNLSAADLRAAAQDAAARKDAAVVEKARRLLAERGL